MSSICAKLPRISLFFIMPSLLLSVAGCSVLPGRDVQPQQRIAGLLEVDGETARLQPCGQKGTLAVTSTTEIQALFLKIAQPGQTALFVDMTARSLADGGLQPLEIVRMQTTGRGCVDKVADTNQWIAWGETPDWRALVGVQGMYWQEPGMASPEPVPVIAEKVPGSSISFQTLRGNARELWISPEDCFERSSGDYFHRTARFIRNGETLSGCAYQGLPR